MPTCICGKEGTARCSRCKAKFYCCSACQKSDWKSHKLECRTPPAPKTNDDEAILGSTDANSADSNTLFIDTRTEEGLRKYLGLGDDLFKKESYHVAERIYLFVHENAKAKFGPDDKLTHEALLKWGHASFRQFKYEQAEESYLSFLNSAEAITEFDPELLLEIMSCLCILGLVYKRQKQYEKAQDYYQRCLDKINSYHLGKNFHQKISCVYNFACLYMEMGKWKEAEPLYLHYYSYVLKKLGPLHDTVFLATHNLAEIYWNLNKIRKAERLLLTCLETKTASFGQYHFSTLDTLHFLGVMYHRIKNYQQAKEYFLRTLEGRRQMRNVSEMEQQLCIAAEMNALAMVLSVGEGKHVEAEELLLKAIDIAERQREVIPPLRASTGDYLDPVKPPKIPLLVGFLRNLHNVYVDQGKPDKVAQVDARLDTFDFSGPHGTVRV